MCWPGCWARPETSISTEDVLDWAVYREGTLASWVRADREALLHRRGSGRPGAQEPRPQKALAFRPALC